jgi:hypothetical protein
MRAKEGTMRLQIVALTLSLSLGPFLMPLSASAQQPQCFLFFARGPQGKVGLRNNCDACKIAVVNFIAGSKSEVREFKVNAHSHVDVDTSKTSSTQVIGEKPCN